LDKGRDSAIVKDLALSCRFVLADSIESAQVTDKDGQTNYYRGVWSDTVAFDVTVWPGAAKQQPRPPPSNPTGHDGGQAFSANKLALLSPHLALIGVVAVVAIVAKRKFA